MRLCSESLAIAEMDDPFATIDMGRNLGGAAAVPLSAIGAGSPSNTLLPGPRRLPPYQVAS